MPYLIHAFDTQEEKIYPLNNGTNNIGRICDTIDIVNNCLSRKHAEIIVEETKIKIKDLQSRNHTFVNNVQIEECEIKDGDLIRFGNLEFKLVYDITKKPLTPPKPEKISLEGTTEQKDLPKNVIKEFSVNSDSFAIQDILDSPGKHNSVIRLPNVDSDHRTVDKLKILLEVSKQLSSPQEPDHLLNKILDLLFEIMNIDRAIILMVNEQNQELEPKVSKSRPGVCTEEQFYSLKIIKFAYNHGKAIVTANANKDDRFCDAESVISQKIKASVCIPLKPREKVIGVLYVDNLSMSNVYSNEDVNFLTALTNQAAIALENVNLYKKIELEAVTRGKLESFFPKAISQKLREEGALEIVDTEVTALFSDISAFTQMSSTMEPRQVISMLNEYFEEMVEEIIFRYEGTLEKYIGDALFAVWGAPYRKPNDAHQAVKAAIEMQWAVQDLNKKWIQEGKLPIQIHIGLNTGKVAAGNIGSKKLIQYATIGDTTNITSRICNVAKPDEIVISESTFEKIKSLNLPLEKMSPVLVKGKKEPLQLYRLLWDSLDSKLTLF